MPRGVLGAASAEIGARRHHADEARHTPGAGSALKGEPQPIAGRGRPAHDERVNPYFGVAVALALDRRPRRARTLGPPSERVPAARLAPTPDLRLHVEHRAGRQDDVPGRDELGHREARLDPRPRPPSTREIGGLEAIETGQGARRPAFPRLPSRVGSP